MATITVAAPTGGDDQALLQNAINASASGDVLVFPDGAIYRHSAKLLLQNKPGRTFRAAGGGQFTWQATNPNQASFHIWTNSHDTVVQGLKHQVIGATTRIDLGFQVAPFVVDYCSRTNLIDCISQGSAGLGIYVFNAHEGEYTRFQVLDSGADAIHHTAGSSYNDWVDAFVDGAGDDGWANIGYLQDGEAGRPHHNTATRPVILDSHARGISFAGAYSCSVTDPDVNGTRATGILFARENGTDFKTSNTENCTVVGGKVRRTQTPKAALGSSTLDPAVHAAAILYDNGIAGGITGCTIDGLSVAEYGPTASALAQLSGNSISPPHVTNLTYYAGSPVVTWQGGTLLTTGWSSKRGQTMAPSATTVAGGGTMTPPGPTYTVRQSATAVLPKSSAASELTVALPSPAKAGNLVVAAVGVDKSAGSFASAGSPWSGPSTYVGASVSQKVLYRAMTADAGVSITFDWATAQGAVAVILEVDGPVGGTAATTRLPATADDASRTSLSGALTALSEPGLAVALLSTDTSFSSYTASGDPQWTAPLTTALTVTEAGQDAGGANVVVALGQVGAGQALTAAASWGGADQAVLTALVIAKATTTPTTPTTTWSLWNGTTETPLTLAGIWDGTALVPVTFDQLTT